MRAEEMTKIAIRAKKVLDEMNSIFDITLIQNVLREIEKEAHLGRFEYKYDLLSTRQIFCLEKLGYTVVKFTTEYKEYHDTKILWGIPDASLVSRGT